MKIFICGFTGAGKTTLLSAMRQKFESDFSYLDLDQLINENIGDESIADFINSKGFQQFRELERDFIAKFDSKKNFILALGGGALNAQTLTYLSSWKGIFLNTPFEVCFQRINGDQSRPLSKLSYDELKQLYSERLAYYSKFNTVENAESAIQLIEKWKLAST